MLMYLYLTPWNLIRCPFLQVIPDTFDSCPGVSLKDHYYCIFGTAEKATWFCICVEKVAGEGADFHFHCATELLTAAEIEHHPSERINDDQQTNPPQPENSGVDQGPETSAPTDSGVDQTPETTPPTDSGVDQQPETTPPTDGGVDQAPETTPPTDSGIDQQPETTSGEDPQPTQPETTPPTDTSSEDQQPETTSTMISDEDPRGSDPHQKQPETIAPPTISSEDPHSEKTTFSGDDQQRGKETEAPYAETQKQPLSSEDSNGSFKSGFLSGIGFVGACMAAFFVVSRWKRARENKKRQEYADDEWEVEESPMIWVSPTNLA